MRVCLILEGCYPYVRGGVSSWAHDYIKSNTDIEFVLWTVHAGKEYAQMPLYEIPENVVETHEVYLEDAYIPDKSKKRITQKEYADYMHYLGYFVSKESVDWKKCISYCVKRKVNISDLIHSKAFLDYAKVLAETSQDSIGLSDSFYGLRSIMMPLIHLIQQEIPQADLYHSAVTGYGGLLGIIAKEVTGKPFVLTEHGIYPREREEELMQADWVVPSMRSVWINSFYNLSRCAYNYADKVTALFKAASEKQNEIGCNENKCSIIANGIHIQDFSDIPLRTNEESINIGAFVRFAPIKDIKTLIYAFYNLQNRVPSAVLFIMGGTDDAIYKQECEDLINRLEIDNIKSVGHINTVEYMKDMDFTVMSSISEGQPLAILESLAAGRPCVTTNVGNCSELLLNEADGFGQAGYCCNPMDIDGLALAMERLCIDKEQRKQFGENGKKRVKSRYTHEYMKRSYRDIYSEVL